MILAMLLMMAAAPSPSRAAEALAQRPWAADLECAGLAEARAESLGYDAATKLAMTHWISAFTIKAAGKGGLKPSEIDRRLGEARVSAQALIAGGGAGPAIAACARDLELALPPTKP